MSGTLVVPIDVAAFCAGKIDASEATKGLAGARTDFSKRTGAPVGEEVMRGLADNDPPLTQLEQGVHLHWALPDALTHAALTDGRLVFPPAPNRWLVSRLVVRGQTVSRRSWIVESDALTTDGPPSATRLPVQSGKNRSWRFVGRSFPLERYVSSGDGRAFKDLTGHDLTAVANGLPGFAAYYPDCRSVFGFHDGFEDWDGAGELMYVVTGWFADLAKDPVRAADPQKKTRVPVAELARRHRWVIPSDTDLDRSLYSGLVQGVAWDPDRRYLGRDYAGNPTPPLQAEVVVGNTPAEALAAYFAGQGAGHDASEQILNALQFGQLAGLAQPKPDQLAKLFEALHEKEFAAVDAGFIHTIVKRPPPPKPEGGVQGAGPRPNRQTAAAADLEPEAGETDVLDEAIDLPPPLADDLNRLNLLQQRCDLLETEMAECRRQIFADWYRWEKAKGPAGDSNRASSANAALTRRLGQWMSFVGVRAPLQDELGREVEQVRARLDETLQLLKTPAERYWQPTEPSLLVASPDLAFPSRYGGDAASGQDGKLVCRLAEQVMTSVTVDGRSLAADAAQLGGALPVAEICGRLLGEACLLNVSLVAARTGLTLDRVRRFQDKLLGGSAPADAGTPPSRVALARWNGNPWLPIFLQWRVEFAPFHRTEDAGTLRDYPREFVTDNFGVRKSSVVAADGNGGERTGGAPDPDGDILEGFLRYAPKVPPAVPAFDQSFSGLGLLSPAPARHFAQQVDDFARRYPSQALAGILARLNSAHVLVQPLAGFAEGLLMRQQNLQLRLPDESQPTARMAKAIIDAPGPGMANSVPTNPRLAGGSYNPIRAGYLKVAVLEALDVFGQRRKLHFPDATCARSLRPAVSLPAGTIYAPPRLSQPARLLFRWISADSAGDDEMNAHPATSPICGWMLPNRLYCGFFLYDGQGKPFGSLSLAGEGSSRTVRWQSAPNGDAPIEERVEKALTAAHPALSRLAVFLSRDPDYFEAFWKAVDAAHESVNPAALGAGLGVLIGRPVALVQASLRLEVMGGPALNQAWACLDARSYCADNGFSAVEFPVMLGDVDQLNDGLVGYFKEGVEGYEYRTFYAEAAAAASHPQVVKPVETTLTLTVTPKTPPNFAVPDPSVVEKDASKVLMLVDPRAPIHAFTGVLPTRALEVPPDLVKDTLSALEMWFPAMPVLGSSDGVALPVPDEPGFQLSWMTERRDGHTARWAAPQPVASPAGSALPYGPQRLLEGWLRFNPSVLEFALVDKATGRPEVTAGAAAPLLLTLTNRKPGLVTFAAGSIAGEGMAASGSIFFIHFGRLLKAEDVGALQFAADGWTFQPMTDARYGPYWAAARTRDALKLFPGESRTIEVRGLAAAAGVVQGQVLFDYYNVAGASDGVYAEMMAVLGSRPSG